MLQRRFGRAERRLVVAMGLVLGATVLPSVLQRSEADAVTSCGYVTAEVTGVTSTTILTTTYCDTCPGGDWVGPGGYHDNLLDAHFYICVRS